MAVGPIPLPFGSRRDNIWRIYYLTCRNLIRFINNVAQPDESKGDIYPTDIKMGFVPNWMNQLQVPRVKILYHGFKILYQRYLRNWSIRVSWVKARMVRCNSPETFRFRVSWKQLTMGGITQLTLWLVVYFCSTKLLFC